MRLLSEKLSDQPESHSDKEKMAEFSVPTWMVRSKDNIFIYNSMPCKTKPSAYKMW